MADFTPQEIEQFLQQFFDVVGARQYVGARYVPIFGRAGSDTVEWDDLAPYEPLTVVMHQGVSYVSRRYVPSGIQITDTDYWVETYRFNAQVEQYRQEVLSFQGQIDDLRDTMNYDFVPFPDPDNYPKYGMAGQVLSTLTDGTTKWEDPVVPSDAQAEEVITEWLDAHPEATTTVQDGAITDAKVSSSSGVMRMLPTVRSGDLDDIVTPNKAMLIIGQSVANRPIDRDGLLVVLGAPVSDGGYLQIYISDGAQIFSRMKWGSFAWTAWRLTADDNYVATALSSVVIEDSNVSTASGVMCSLPNVRSGDLDDIVTPNKAMLIIGQSVANRPIDRDGLLVVLGAPVSGGGYLQLFISWDRAQVFSRMKWGNFAWTTWKQIADTDFVTQAIEAAIEAAGASFISNQILTAFSNITCCGDSLTYSQVYTGASTSRQAYKPYPTQLEMLTGVTTENIAVGGYDAIHWWNAFNSQIVQKPNQLAIIYLGTNNGLTDTLATDCPTNTAYTNWANTNTGCYGKMIAKFQENGSKILLVKCYTTSGSGTSSLEITNDVIEQMGSRFGCAVVDNAQFTDIKYHYYPDLNGSNGTHYNDLGYAAFTNQLLRNVGKLETEQMKYLIPA